MNDKCICDLKEKEEKRITHGDWVDLYIKLEDKEYWIVAEAEGNAMMKIEYCPKCGRKLEEFEEDDYSENL